MDELTTEKRLLVDFENVQMIDLSALPDGFQVTIFVGGSQKNVPFDLVQGAQSLGPKLEWLKVDGSGRNALDFHIAYYLGSLLTRFPQTECFILSRDSGFDPLVRHLTKNGMCCRRLNSLLELDERPAVVADPNYKRVVDLLTKVAKKSRPRRRTTLTQYVAAIFQKKLSKAEVERMIDLLFAEGKVAETNQTLSYSI